MTAMLADSSSAWPVDFKGRPSQWTSRVVTAASSSEVRTVDFQPFVEQRPGWLGAVVDRVQMMDEAGVDVSESARRTILSILQNPIFTGTPEPLLAPVEGGGLCAEFRTASVELQVEVLGSGEAEAYVVKRGGIEWEGPLADLPDGIEKWAWRLAHPGV
jgi:hypothetical protein